MHAHGIRQTTETVSVLFFSFAFFLVSLTEHKVKFRRRKNEDLILVVDLTYRRSFSLKIQTILWSLFSTPTMKVTLSVFKILHHYLIDKSKKIFLKKVIASNVQILIYFFNLFIRHIIISTNLKHETDTLSIQKKQCLEKYYFNKIHFYIFNILINYKL